MKMWVSLMMMLLVAAAAQAEAPPTVEAQKEAVRLFPELGKRESEFNKRFGERLRILRGSHDPILEEGIWPVVIAHQVAKELASASKASPTPQATPPHATPAGFRQEAKEPPVVAKSPPPASTGKPTADWTVVTPEEVKAVVTVPLADDRTDFKNMIGRVVRLQITGRDEISPKGADGVVTAVVKHHTMLSSPPFTSYSLRAIYLNVPEKGATWLQTLPEMPEQSPKQRHPKGSKYVFVRVLRADLAGALGTQIRNGVIGW